MAAKGKYFFNPESLQFEGIRPSIRRTIKRTLTLLLTSFLIAAAYYFAYSAFFDTPTERAKKRENVKLKTQLALLNERYNQIEKVINNISVRDTNIFRAIFEANPINTSSESSMAINENGQLGDLEDYNNNEISKKITGLLKSISSKASNEDKALKNLMEQLQEKSDDIRYIPSIQPVENKSLTAAGASIGMRISPFFKSLKLHTGMDFAVPVGTDVKATADGIVDEVKYSQKNTGNYVIINHGESSYETRYLYLGDISVKKGQKVERGQTIGKVGNLGMTVPHLHYEVRKDGKVADPLNFFFMELTPSEYERILAISVHNGQSLD